ncbi:SH (U2) putative protein [Boteke virus]|uniref:Small hydrophobic protein n=1 Tax=Boteke virus TaxID=864698 RepID=A0AAE9BMR5_9RHAB|nr:SH (U2) putative protein [Boteke virus]UAU42843.1 SH (U2) putative protein [Boteke virus]
MILLLILGLLTLLFKRKVAIFVISYTLGYYNLFGDVINYATFLCWYLLYHLPIKWFGSGMEEAFKIYFEETAE